LHCQGKTERKDETAREEKIIKDAAEKHDEDLVTSWVSMARQDLSGKL